MFRASQFVVALVGTMFTLQARAVTVDLTAGAAGTIFINQSFNETRAAEVEVVSPVDLNVLSMTLTEFNVVSPATGMLGAHIFDSTTATLLASADTAVGSGFDQSLTIPIFATLESGRSYRVGFFLDVGGSAGSGDFLDVNPPGLPVTPYIESTGLLQVNGTFQLISDGFPTNTNSFLPYISLDVRPVPEPGPVALAATAAAASGASLLKKRRRQRGATPAPRQFWDRQ